MEIAVIADTHMPRGRRALPRECVVRLRAAELIVHAGDFTGAEALAEIEAIGPPLVAVHGNVDTAEVRERLPERAEFEAGGARIGVIHDAGPRRGRLARMRREFPGADAVVFGHSHLPLHEREDDFQIFNPGSPTERRRAPAHTIGIAEVAAGRIEFRLIELTPG
ncbi:MAG: metallophosphoesterase family protein [Solirubrobacterales bacterium]